MIQIMQLFRHEGVLAKLNATMNDEYFILRRKPFSLTCTEGKRSPERKNLKKLQNRRISEKSCSLTLLSVIISLRVSNSWISLYSFSRHQLYRSEQGSSSPPATALLWEFVISRKT